MKYSKQIILVSFMTLSTISYSQKGSIHLREVPQKKSLFKQGGLWNNESKTPEQKTLAPLILKKKDQPTPDIFTQLINWDCKIKVRINSRFNLVVTYS